MGIDAMMRAMTPQKSRGIFGEGAAAETEGGQAGGASGLKVEGGGLPEPVEVSSVSYLSVPDTQSTRRPSTADFVIEKLQVEKVEGGGLSIQGVALASNCHVTLCVFGVFFMVAGIILSYVSYSVAMRTGGDSGGGEGKEKAEAMKGQSDEVSSVSQMRMIGPAFLVLGFLMLFLGITLFALAKKISHDEKVRQRVLADQQLWQLENSFSYANASTSPLHTAAPAPHQQYPILAVRRSSWWMDPAVMEGGGTNVYGEPATALNDCDTAVPCPSPHRESQGGSSPRVLSPVPLELLPDASDSYKDIACFPPPRSTTTSSATQQQVGSVPEGGKDDTSTATDQRITTTSHAPSSTEMRSTTPLLSSAAQELRTATLLPSSATQVRSHGATTTYNVTQIPCIQVTAAGPQTPTLLALPRLSRHCFTRHDSRPTTADSR
ncbi:uncharacterized protein LOC121871780 isoform X2 [Homarus americanus]|uniref:uncharacterized protein LOC121871780 isoform X2 n=1 Tax=Homarus americanus TaxID=6706 RepID=UPI001C43C13F|nr:uncharacterized protein LOC121871780 isoform X2 [Homarus americanus]